MLAPVGGRRIIETSGNRILHCQCDASSLVLELPAKIKGSFCKLCDLTGYKPPDGLPRLPRAAK